MVLRCSQSSMKIPREQAAEKSITLQTLHHPGISRCLPEVKLFLPKSYQKWQGFSDRDLDFLFSCSLL